MVRNQVVNKIADEGFKPEWNELLHMLERRLQRDSECFRTRSQPRLQAPVPTPLAKASEFFSEAFSYVQQGLELG